MAVLICPLKCSLAKQALMKMNQLVVLVVLALGACSHEPEGVRVVNDAANAPTVTKSKIEPVFYNGKTYQVSLSPAADGNTALNIAGMNGAQARDANGLATSSFHHFACKDSQKAVVSTPTFDGAIWHASAHCA